MPFDDLMDPTSNGITLGILAGGRASRLGGLDKAWLERDGVPQVLRLARRLDSEVDAILVSANCCQSRYAAHGLAVVADLLADAGPMAGLDALARACGTPWLLSIPVDVVGVDECLLRSLVADAATDGAFAIDGDGAQPLVALWRVESLRQAIDTAVAGREFAVHGLQQQLAMAGVRFPGVRLGNLNTPADLIAAGIGAAP